MDFAFRAIWPVEDPFATLPSLIPHAELQLEAMAAEHNVKLTGDPVWTLRDGRLHVSVPAQPLPVVWERPVPPWDDPRPGAWFVADMLPEPGSPGTVWT